MMARILIFTPTYDDMLAPETAASVEAQEFNGELDWEIDDRDLYPGRSMREVCEKYLDARQMALDGGYDALLTVEHDMILPPDAAQKLWDTDAPVVYGAYMLRHGVRVINLFQYLGNQNLGMSLSLYPDELKKARRHAAVQVSGGGMGCTLFKREALERVPFRVFDDKPPDMTFAAECVRANVKQVGRFDVPCVHISPDGEHITVDDMADVVRVEALADVVLPIGDGTVRQVKRGRYYSMTVSAANEAARAGYVRQTNTLDDDEAEGREVAVAPQTNVVKSEPGNVEKRPANVTKRRPRKRAVSGDSD